MTNTVPHVIFQACHARVSWSPTTILLLSECPYEFALHPLGALYAFQSWDAEPVHTMSVEEILILLSSEKGVSVSRVYDVAQSYSPRYKVSCNPARLVTTAPAERSSGPVPRIPWHTAPLPYQHVLACDHAPYRLLRMSFRAYMDLFSFPGDRHPVF